ncbi:MAG: hypothetical protein R3A79_29980 [Nannocystaceae bacterium]
MVMPWPLWTGNPYLPRLMAALGRQGFAVRRRPWLRVGVAGLRRDQWVHFHWPGGPLLHRDRDRYAKRIARMRRTLAAMRAKGIRVAWTAHNLLPHDDPHPDLGRALREAVLAEVEHVFLHFPGAEAILARELGYTGPTSLVPHPHYIDEHPAPPTQAAARAALGLPAGGLVALIFGLLRPYKGIGAVIRGFLATAGDDDRLVIAGAPRPGVDAELALAREDPRVVTHLRRIPGAEVPTYFAAADASMIAYREFFTSGAAVLSLSMGCPIVGPAHNHLADLGGEPHLFACDVGPEGIAAALERLRSARDGVDRPAIREWARVSFGDWDDAARAIAAVLRRPRP